MYAENVITSFSVGSSTGQKVVTALFALLFVAVLGGILTVAGVALGLFGAVANLLGGDPYESDLMGLAEPGAGSAPPLFAGFFLVIVLFIVAVFVSVILSVFRYGAALEAGTLRVRGAFRTRWADLSLAKSWIDSAPAPARLI
jgi:hypothetical protein